MERKAPWQAGPMPASRADLPTYLDLMLPTIRAVDALGGSAQGREVTTRVLNDIGATDEQLAVVYESRPKSVLVDRIEWARSYAKLGGALESPRRGLYVLTTLGKEILSLPETEAKIRILELDHAVKAARVQSRLPTAEGDAPVEEEVGEDTSWREVLLQRLHGLTPEGFEEFVLYLLRTSTWNSRASGVLETKASTALASPPLVRFCHRASPFRPSGTTRLRRLGARSSRSFSVIPLPLGLSVPFS